MGMLGFFCQKNF